jgi:hypothetical protein
MGEDLRDRVAVIDAITWVNPQESTEGSREVDRLSPTGSRVAARERVKKRNENRGVQEHRHIRRPFVMRLRRVLAFCDNLPCWPTRR